MSHHCKAILFHCMDFRLIQKTKEWMEKENLINDCDVVSIAGSSKSIADGETLPLKQIETSYHLHHSRQIIFLHHSDCGAYKSSYVFESKEQEKQKQLEDMQKAEDIIKQRFNDVEVIKVWAEMLDEEGKNVSFKKL